VTGGAGFIGSHLCDRLIEQGNEVVVLDDYSTGRIGNIVHLNDNHNFYIRRLNVVNSFKLGHIDQIYNLACPASPVAYQADPIKTMTTSVLGAINALELAKTCGARILQTSTSEVYGDPQVHPQPEDYWGNVNPIGIRACYDEGKRAAECLFMDYHRQHNVDVRIVRIFNTYGPRMHPDDGRVISNFIRQAINGEQLTVYGNGRQTRSFCYVSDMVDGLIKMMNTEGVTGPINLGNADMEYNITEVAERVISRISTPSRIVHCTLPHDDPQRRRPDLSKAEDVLDWAPKVPLMAGLEKTIEWFQSQAVKVPRRSVTMSPNIQGL
jgi:UDP-glucuronate decarboxylase